MIRDAEQEPTPNIYVRYASLRRWYWALARIAVVVGVVVLLRPWPLAAQGVIALAIVDAYVRLAVRDAKPVAWIGLGLRGAVLHTVAGFVLGALLMSAMIGVFAAAGWYEVQAVRWSPAGFGYWVAFFLLVSVLEEILSRGFMFRWVERRSGSVLALVVSSLVFGLLHAGNPNATLVAGLAIAVEAGLLLAAAYMLTRTLWFPIGIHWSWNLFEGPVFSTPVSGNPSAGILRSVTRGPEVWTGGSFGPEGGLVAVIIGTTVGALLLWAAVRRGHWLPMRGRPGAKLSDPDLPSAPADIEP
jgi:membrane protease YdiL (CAAX protease family)